MKTLLLSLLTLFILLGCSSDAENSATNNQHIAYLEPQVSGVTYKTASQTGITGKDGSFSYGADDDNVSFSVGALDLGTIAIKQQMNLFELSIGELPSSNTKQLTTLTSSEPYKKMLNELRLLHFLDYDGNISNGIEITAEVAATVPELELLTWYEGLVYEPAYQKMFKKINREQMLQTRRQIPSMVIVMQDFYNYFGLESPDALKSEINAYSELTYHYNEQGFLTLKETYDISSMQTREDVYTYDTRGNKLRYIYDDDNSDGIYDYDYRYSFNDIGQRIGQDRDRDGSKDYINMYIYDEQENLTRREIDEDGNGTIDVITTYFYDENGRVARQLIDSDADTVAETKTEYLYDVMGNQLSYKTFDIGNETATKAYIYTYDARGNRLSYNKFINGIKTSESISTYDLDDNELIQWSDSDANGTANREAHYTYDIRGNKTMTLEDNSGDGIYTFIQTNTYNDNDQLLRQESNSSTSNYSYLYEYKYDEKFNKTEMKFTNQKANSYYTDTYVYDDNSNLTRSFRIDNGGVIMKFIYEYSYDVKGNVLVKTQDRVGDGATVNTTNYTYASLGGWWYVLNYDD